MSCGQFVDNEAAVASLIKASSKQPDAHLICQFAHALLFRLGAQVWFEWIDSASNPSDGLSRDGLNDPWTSSQNWVLTEVVFPSELLPSDFFTSFESLVS